MNMEKIQDFSVNRDEMKDQTNEDVIEEVVEDVDSNASENHNETKKVGTKPAGFDSLFENLYSDVAGANNFISNLIEQKKKVGVNEAYLEEEKTK